MAANHTPVFRLNQWSPEDPVLREDFNTDNMTVENALNNITNNLRYTGNARVEFSTYRGSGGGKMSLDFVSRPAMLLIMGIDSLIIPGQPASGTVFQSSPSSTLRFSWTENSVSWDTPSGDAGCNVSGRTYHYLALYHTPI